MKVYLAGPMRGLPDWNARAFMDAEARWRGAGHQPFNPYGVNASLGYTGEDRNNRHALEHFMSIDMACLFAAEAIALLPGWGMSRGATVELAMAQFLGLKIYDAITMQEIEPPLIPWACHEQEQAHFTATRSVITKQH